MKTFAFLLMLASLPAFAASSKQLDEGRCFDIKQSVIGDLPHFCASKKTDQSRLQDFGHQIDLIEKSCGQPQLAHLLRKALQERVSKQSGAGCMATAERAVLPAKAAKAQAKAASENL